MSDQAGMLLLGCVLFLMFGVLVPWAFWRAYIRGRDDDESE